jgi:glycerophosphoryl diester phosphodiesterase
MNPNAVDPKLLFPDLPNLVVAHRGLTTEHLENTLLALTSAFEHGADGVEFDVQLSRDLVPMVFHDRELERLTQKKANIDELDFEELRMLEQRHEKYAASYPISTLEEVLNAMPAQKLINIELKETTIAQGNISIQKVLDIIKPFQNKLSIIISSFDPKILEAVSELDPRYALGLLIDQEPALKDYLNNNILAGKISYVNPHISLINNITSKLLVEKHIKLILWGHFEMGQEHSFITEGHAALISDIPLELIKLLK